MNTEQEILVKRLREADLSLNRFLKVGKPNCVIDDDKKAFEPEWQKKLYSPEDLVSYPRWGINGSDFLVLIDTDDQRLYDALNKVLPETFEVTSPRRGLPHKYFVVCGKQVQNSRLYLNGVLDAEGKPKSIGEVRANNNYLVAPGTEIRFIDEQTSKAKTGMYTITKDMPITRLEYADFAALITPFLGSNPTQNLTIDQIENGIPEGERHTVLYQEACKFACAGVTGPFVLDALRTTASRCKPPFTDEEELNRMVKNALKFKAEQDEKKRKLAEGKRLIEIIGSAKNKTAEEKLGEFLEADAEFKTVYEGNYKKYFGKREKAEAYLVYTLLKSGFTVEETRKVMEGSKSGKWNSDKAEPEEREEYQDNAIEKAQNTIMRDAANPAQKRGDTAVEGADINVHPIVYDSDTEKAIELEVQKIVDADNQLDALSPHLDNMIVGENDVKKAAAILLLSGKVPNPKMKQIILFKSTEGAGKSHTATSLTRGYKTKHVGRFSEHALDYTDLKGYEVLFLKELGLMDEEKQGVSTLKFLSSDDLGYTVEVTVKDEETGKFTTEQRRIPPITVISTTTRLIMDKQFERRAFPFGLDETSEQTKAIAGWTAKNELEEAGKLLGTRKSTSQEFSSAVYSRFIEGFVPKNIIVPFPKTLLKVLGVEVLRVRGDMNKLLTFMKLYGQLNVKRLKSAGKDGLYVLSSDVALEALNIILEPLSDMLSRIDKRTKQVFEGLKGIVDVKSVLVCKVNTEMLVRHDAKGSEIDKKIRDRVAVKIGKSESTVRKFLNQLESGGYVSSDDKKPKTFTLLYDISEIETKISGISCKIKSHDTLVTEMDKEAQEWRGSLSCNALLGGSDNTVLGAGEAALPNLSEESALAPRIILHDTSLPPSQTALAETPTDNCAIQKCTISREEKPKTESTSVGLIPCPECRARGKPMFFGSDGDLRNHTRAYHETEEERLRAQ